MTIGGVNGAQAWAILKRHAQDEIGPLRLQELCRDNDRVSSLVAVHNSQSVAFSMTTTDQPSVEQDRMLLLDLSRQRMTTNTLNHLLQLATARGLPKFIQQLSWGGHNDPNNPVRPVRLSTSPNGSNHVITNGGSLSNNPQHRRYTKIKNNNINTDSRGIVNTVGYDSSSKNNASYRTARFENDKHTVGVSGNPPRTPSPIDTTAIPGPTGTGITSTSAASATQADTISSSSMHMALRVPKDEGCEMLLEVRHGLFEFFVGIHVSYNMMVAGWYKCIGWDSL